MFTYITINTIPYCIPQILPTPPIIKRTIFNHFSLAGLTKQKCDQYKCSIGPISAVGLNGANRNPKTPPTCLCFGLDSSIQLKIFYLIQNSGGIQVETPYSDSLKIRSRIITDSGRESPML